MYKTEIKGLRGIYTSEEFYDIGKITERELESRLYSDKHILHFESFKDALEFETGLVYYLTTKYSEKQALSFPMDVSMPRENLPTRGESLDQKSEMWYIIANKAFEILEEYLK